MRGFPLAIRFVLTTDFVLDLGEMIVDVTERIVDLCEGEMWVGLLDSLDGVAGSETLVDQSHRNASSDNHGVTPADRGIFMYVTMIGLDCLGHDSRIPMVMDDAYGTSLHHDRQARLRRGSGMSVDL